MTAEENQERCFRPGEDHLRQTLEEAGPLLRGGFGLPQGGETAAGVTCLSSGHVAGTTT
jgi:hypothetical protein